MGRKRQWKLNSLTADKRGLSPLVITILIVVMALIALGIVWQIIAGIVESSKEDVDFGQSRINLKLSSVFIDVGVVSLKTSRLVGIGEMDGLKFIFSDGKNSEIVENLTSLEELEEKTFYLSLTNLDVVSLKTVSVAPIIVLPSGNKRVGNILDTYTIRKENYDQDYYGDLLEGGQSCLGDYDCPAEIEGSSECDLETGDIFTYWNVSSCIFGRCISNIVLKLSWICPDGCSESAECSNVVPCTLETVLEDCTATRETLAYCYNGDVYKDVPSSPVCPFGYCLYPVSQVKVRDCEKRGCVIVDYKGECNPSLQVCYEDEVCEADGIIPYSEHCVGNEVYTYFKDNYCGIDNNCTNDLTLTLKENCSAMEGQWDCINGECIEYIECSNDEHCNVLGICDKMCVDEHCVVANVFNSGFVNSIWPFETAEYFDSSSLPKMSPEENITYVNHFVNFTSGSEGRCLMVREHVYPESPEKNSYIRFDVRTTLVRPGDGYDIWKTKTNCECGKAPEG